MRPFNLEEYLKDPSKKLVTRDGRKARIICTDREHSAKEDYPIVALISMEENEEFCGYFTKNGEYIEGSERPSDLFFAPIKHEGWANIYANYGTCCSIYPTLEEALTNRIDENYITTTKIEWEE